VSAAADAAAHQDRRELRNQRVQRLLKSAFIQAKLQVNEPGDPYEQEADRISRHVSAAPAHSSVSGGGHIRRDAGQPCGEAVTAPASVQRALVSPGDPLEPVLCREMEERFGHDFSGGECISARPQSSRAGCKRRAYTVGNNMVCGAGEFSPGNARRAPIAGARADACRAPIWNSTGRGPPPSRF
jgi:Domain of unknown function (DUF4157)